jgi:hypothetical protein
MIIMNEAGQNVPASEGLGVRCEKKGTKELRDEE